MGGVIPLMHWKSNVMKRCILTCYGRCAGLQAIKAYKREDFVGICGFASVDWVTADFANTYSGEVSLPRQLHLL